MSDEPLAFFSRLYLRHLHTLNYSRRTVELRETCLGAFLNWCEERGLHQLQAITRPVLLHYQRHLSRQPGRGDKVLGIGAQRNHLTAIRLWCQYLTRENYLTSNPASELDLPKTVKALPKAPLTAAEMAEVLAQPDTNTDAGLRDRTILEVFYSTGIRRMELVNLRKQDIHGSLGVLAVRQGKGNKDRFVPIGKQALGWLETYLCDVRLQYQVPDSPENVFLTDTGEALDRHWLSRRVTAYIQKAGVSRTGSCHLIRHTMATLLLDNGADIRILQELLGHASISTTEVYTHVAIHKLKAVHQSLHPAHQGTSAPATEAGSKTELLALLAAEASEDLHSL